MPEIIKNILNFISSQIRATFQRAALTEHTFVLVAAVIIGLVGGYGAVVIQYSIKVFQNFLWQGPFNLDTIAQIPWYFKILIPVFGGVVVGLIIQFYSSEAKGHGVPEVMQAIALKNGIIRPRVVIAKLFASALYIASGGSVGREGPVIQIGSAVGSTLGQFLKVNPKRMRTFVACGAASGIAAAFNAPVAGALFSVEIILGDFAVPQFSPIVISSVVATVVSRHFLGDFPAFIVPKYTLGSPLELLNYVVLGFLAGSVAVLFIKSLYGCEDFFDNLKMPQFAQSAIGGLIIGLIGMFFPQIFGVGYDAMDQALTSNLVGFLALVLVFMKIGATSVSLGSGGSGGIFAPSLFLGAMLGSFYGFVVNAVIPGASTSPGAFALVAMGGVVAATTHGPITSILIIFEMTNDYKIILPLMITVIISTLLSIRLHKESIYTLKLVNKGINIFGGREINVLRSLKVEDVPKQPIDIINARESFTNLLDKIVSSPNSYIYVADDNEKVKGYVSIQEMRQSLLDFDVVKDLLIVQDVVNPNIKIINETDDLDYVMKEFGRSDMDEFPVINIQSGKESISGVIRQTDVIEAYNHQIFLRDMSGEVSQSFGHLKKKKLVHVVDHYHFSEIEAPLSFVDKTLEILDLRNRYNLELLLIKRGGLTNGQKPEYVHPHRDTQIKMNDVLVVFGAKQDIENLSNW